MIAPFARRRLQQDDSAAGRKRRRQRAQRILLVFVVTILLGYILFLDYATPVSLDVDVTNADDLGKKAQKPPPQIQPPSAKRMMVEKPVDANRKATSPSVVQLLQEGLPKSARVHRFGESNATANSNIVLDKCSHTMVTGYFKVRSKYTADNYLGWMANFLSIQDCMVIFTSSDMVETILKFRSTNGRRRTVLIEMSIDDLPLAQLGKDFWQHQLDIDREKRIHRSYQLFWIWLSKSWCVTQAINLNYFSSDNLFMWQDIGSYRIKKYNGKQILQHPEIVPTKTILWMAHHPPNAPPNPIWNDKFKQKQHYFHSGSQGVGDETAWVDYHKFFAATIQQFLDRDMFIGEDQCVLQSTCQQHPELCAYIRSDQVNDNFYFGLRYALVKGGEFELWRMPPMKKNPAT